MQTRAQLPVFKLHQLNNNLKILKESYLRNGVIHLQGMLSESQLKAISKEIETAETNALDDLKLNWENKRTCFFTNNPNNQEKLNNAESFVNEKYFQTSDDKIHAFFEEVDGHLKLNRLGHGLHRLKRYPYLQALIYKNTGLNELLKALNYSKPICLLSAYIPKLPKKVGSKVKPHQESTFAHTKPTSCSVLWIALEDSSIENACMWGILGSNKYPLKYVSKVNRELKKRDYLKINDVEIPEFSFENQIYSPLEVKAGDALFFHGNFVHCSPVNSSNKSRKAITFQFIETQGVAFSNFNWIEKPNKKTLY